MHRQGLREAHAHVAAYGREMSALALADCGTREEALDRIAAAASRLDAAGEPGWLVAAGVRVAGWREPRWPTMRELDRACPDRPCFVRSFDYHSCAVNSAAFAAAGYHETSADPAGGVIERGKDGRVTGLLLESAYARARDAVPEPTMAQWRRHVKAGAEALAGMGFEEVHDLLSQPWLGDVLRDLDARGELPVRVRMYVPLEELPAAEERALLGAASGPAPEQRVVLGGAKVFADGTLNSRTAWMVGAYADPIPGKPRGTPMMAPGAIEEAVRRCGLHGPLGLELAVHAIGDMAVRAVLDAAERTGEGSRVRIEHAEVIDEHDVPRFAALGVRCSVQPCHLLYDIEVLRRQFPGRLERVLPLRELIDSGLTPGEGLLFGSDVPIVRADPRDSILAAVHRRREGMPASEAIGPGQAITEGEAWACFGRPSNGRGP